MNPSRAEITSLLVLPQYRDYSVTNVFFPGRTHSIDSKYLAFQAQPVQGQHAPNPVMRRELLCARRQPRGGFVICHLLQEGVLELVAALS